MTLKTGTRIEVEITHPAAAQKWERAKIGRWLKSMGPRSSLPDGYHPFTFESGGGLMIHESNFRVVDNRKGYGPQ